MSALKALQKITPSEFEKQINLLPEKYRCQLASIIIFDLTADPEYNEDLSSLKKIASGIPQLWTDEECFEFEGMFIKVGYSKEEAEKKTKKMIKIQRGWRKNKQIEENKNDS